MDDLPQKQQASKSSEAAVAEERTSKVESLTMRNATDDGIPSTRDTEKQQQSQTAEAAKVDSDISDEKILAELILKDLTERLAEEKVAETSLKSTITEISKQLANEYHQEFLEASKNNILDPVRAAWGEVNIMLKEHLIDLERSKFKKISASLRKVILNYEKLARLILQDLTERLAEETVAENSLKSSIRDISNQLARKYQQELLQARLRNASDPQIAATGMTNRMLAQHLMDLEDSTVDRVADSLFDVLWNYEKAQEEERQQLKHNERSNSFASIAYQITDSSLTHNSDLSDFSNKIRHVYDEFYSGNNFNDYIGPYFAFVQSSGMGKTKIMYEFKKLIDKNDEEDFVPSRRASARLVLCRNQTTSSMERQEKENAVFDTFLSFDDNHLAKSISFDGAMRDVFAYLDSEFIGNADREDETPQRLLILMFDEAHYLLQERKFPDREPMDAFFFRAIRLWICTRWTKTRVVAVFTGTNTRIGNFRIESDSFALHEKKQVPTDSRTFVPRASPRHFFRRGAFRFVPFVRTTTIGCLHKRMQEKRTKKADSEYRNLHPSEYQLAIPHGRPLFAQMSEDRDDVECLSKGLGTIVSRMLINRKNWEYRSSAWISILGTRVQMGQTSIKVASEMVASAYANLVNVDDSCAEMAKVTFMPDPVCARLAMCLMDNDWSMTRSVPPSTGRTAEWTLNGKAASWWSEKAQEIFSDGICTPEKGDAGDIMVALYFLFCGDVLRKKQDDDYQTFSVDLGSWIYQLKGVDTKAEGTVQATPSVSVSSLMAPSSKKRGHESISKEDVQGTISFSAIQVCRNYLRAYSDSWASLVSQPFLRHIYEAGVGFYTYPSCKTIDMVFALKMTKGPENVISYLPMVVSVKAQATFTSEAARKECDEMIDKARKLPMLCFLVVLGGKEEDDGERTLSKECVNTLLHGHPVAQVLRVPRNDRFGITKAFLGSTSARQEESEILSSHYFLGAHSADFSLEEESTHVADNDSKFRQSSYNTFVKSVLRSSSKALEGTEMLLHALRDRK